MSCHQRPISESIVLRLMPDSVRHPFLEGLSKHRGAPPTILVIFGASGDLTSRKLVPALFNLALDSLLPPDFRLIGYGRNPMPDEAFRELSTHALNEFSRRPLDPALWSDLSAKISYHAGGYDEPEAFTALAKRIAQMEREADQSFQLVFYVSTPPSVFSDIVVNLGRSGLAGHVAKGQKSKIIIEKPFGRDLDSARALNKTISQHFDESQVYRIDHYLGKETVQNLLVARFANSIFEPIWNREFVESVQITVAESVGVGSRGGYYDHSGAMRDMLQNHTMQLLALIAMEAPVSLEAESIRDEKVKVLKGIQPVRLTNDDTAEAVRARYVEGLLEGEKVRGYMQEANIPPDSTTETYAALCLHINNWRWQGVPFYMRSGKRLPRRVSEIAIQFKRPPGILFSGSKQFDITANQLVIQVQPDEGMTLLTNSKIPGLETRTQPVKMHFRYATTFGSNTPEAYERLILDCMIGDSTLFIRGDETEASWKLITPIHEHWAETGQRGMHSYAAGSWGPLEADRMLWHRHHEWRRIGVS